MPAEPTATPSVPAARVTRWLLLGVLVAGCGWILQPFFPAILLAIVLAVSTWPAQRWLLARVGGRQALASAIGCVLTLLVAITPAVLLVSALGDGLAWLTHLLAEWRDAAHPAPAWLSELPLFGPQLADWWASGLSAEPARMLAVLGGPAQKLVLASGEALGSGLLQGTIAAVLLYFIYRHGDALARGTDEVARLIFAEQAPGLLASVRRTVVGIMVSVIGAGLGQACVAAVGFAIVGAPNPLLLAALTFIVSMVPVGPPVIWLGVSLWLFRSGEPGWMLFMLLYGFFGISAIDNVLKPLLISRSSHLPFALTLLGVVGGLIGFGVMGVFLGPTLLALALHLGQHQLQRLRAPAPPEGEPT